MLSKSKGQILRVSAVLHVLFHINAPLDIPEIISENAVKAADNFVDFCLQHAAFLAGRGVIQEAVDDIQEGTVPWGEVWGGEGGGGCGGGIHSSRYGLKMLVHAAP